MKTFILALPIALLSLIVHAQESNPLFFPKASHNPIAPFTTPKKKQIKPEDILLEKQLLYDQHTLADTYPYKNSTRTFQWDKVRERLAFLETIQQTPASWAVLRNYKNKHGEAPTIKHYKRNAYKNLTDTFNVERYQGIPLYPTTDSVVPERYHKDGSLVFLLGEEGKRSTIQTVDFEGTWLVPQPYIKAINKKGTFEKAIFVDRTNQNITTLEKVGSKWLIRSMNPATTGLHQPPFKYETPRGIFVLQEKKRTMFYYKDGTTTIGGSSPYANRFTNGAYIHGVPVDLPRKEPVEFSASLGTTPRSHMCIRNATSHAKHIYDWAPTEETLVFVFD